ncbi:DinB family protein [Deinococcus taeanensis]|uniref:DinB family protein n=1 Tax=Deinococcus taeanensis TaxID=2737050 RepID=UPI001CDC76D9|nr:DinB family protein [Deinococcus taeanensis]UBV42167.1 DinB family protein [Deinococcus taeanensis]
MTQTLTDRSVLAALGATPDDVRTRLHTELDRFEAHLHTRQADWTQVQPGRDWSPAQEAEHVLLINDGVARGVALLLSERELRPTPQVPGELTPDGRRIAPLHTRPSETGLAWTELDGRWVQSRTQLLQVVQNLRETPDRTLWHPYFGALDALDWTRMLAAHLRQHRQSLERSAQP